MTPGEWVTLIGMLLSVGAVGAVLYAKIQVMANTIKDLVKQVESLVKEKDTRIATCAHHAAELDNLKKRVDSLEQRSFHAG